MFASATPSPYVIQSLTVLLFRHFFLRAPRIIIACPYLYLYFLPHSPLCLRVSLCVSLCVCVRACVHARSSVIGRCFYAVSFVVVVVVSFFRLFALFAKSLPSPPSFSRLPFLCWPSSPSHFYVPLCVSGCVTFYILLFGSAHFYTRPLVFFSFFCIVTRLLLFSLSAPVPFALPSPSTTTACDWRIVFSI